ncbi:Fe3+ hydroxamate ABC transporter substrate-binding protein [Oceanobacillus polygoni]|uniref:Fe3+ hydroxamate ABC transporter substrate-binding protein n=1 Tax=Oceanobacillus polygoni TaxID=1235259 RepID=A0A9X0YPE2_9BACI|nr:Fe3+ hydroxamate ABC transporter substrate-binding protein [Oceanobacillus polygoni]MBP2076673.1 hypothetical protein [Oceanobacillus polygoni]
MFPFKIEQTCSGCGKEIMKGEEIFAKMSYPFTRGSAEIMAYLYQNAKVFCANCVAEKGNE